MNHVILFDGNCTFCNRSVQFIMKRDPKAIFSFASLQGELGQYYRKQFALPDNLDSMIYIKNDSCYTKSTAVLKVCQSMNGFYPLLSVFLIVPKPLRDFVYQIIAKNRHKLNQNHTCHLPTAEERKRFLE